MRKIDHFDSTQLVEADEAGENYHVVSPDDRQLARVHAGKGHCSVSALLTIVLDMLQHAEGCDEHAKSIPLVKKALTQQDARTARLVKEEADRVEAERAAKAAKLAEVEAARAKAASPDRT